MSDSSRLSIYTMNKSQLGLPDHTTAAIFVNPSLVAIFSILKVEKNLSLQIRMALYPRLESFFAYSRDKYLCSMGSMGHKYLPRSYPRLIL
jgi:hypothetical protein